MHEVTMYERRSDFLNSIMEVSLSTFGDGSFISFEHHIVEGYYRGEDSGARYPEFSAAINDATFYVYKVLDQIYYDETIRDLIKKLQYDHAERVPINRHKKLVSFLIENSYLLRRATEQFEKAIKKINAYYDLDFEFSFKEMRGERSLNVVRCGQVLASYNVNDVDYDILTNQYTNCENRYPCYENRYLMWYLHTHPEYLVQCYNFDCFDLLY